MALALLLSLCLALPATAAPKKGPPPNMPGMPGMGKGPPWRNVVSKVFNEACVMNRNQPSVFCFPDTDELIDGLAKAADNGADLTGEMFLLDVHVVMEQLLSWPPAWPGVIDVFNKKRPWTKPYCDKIMGESPIWRAVPLVRRSFIAPRQTLAQVEKDSPHVFAAMNKWFEQLKANGDSQTKLLLKAVRDNDKIDIKNKSAHARPMMRLMQHEHAKVVQHLFGTACKKSKLAWEKIEQSDGNGLTVLHHVASLGDTAGARAILKSTPKAKRVQLAGVRDHWGYTAKDWALLGDFEDTAEALQSFSGDSEEAPAATTEGPSAPVEPWRLFPASLEGASSVSCEGSAEECSSGLSAGSESDTGGWNQDAASDSKVPSEWLPPVAKPCFADTIDVSQFDFEVFASQYVLHPRPLLIRGGGRLPASVAGNYTRAGLLSAAGNRKVSAERFLDAKVYDGSKPLTMELDKYLEFLGNRSGDRARKKLHYAYLRLQDEVQLNFSGTLPTVLDGKVDLTGTIFYVGGRFMGVPPRHHGPSANSLVYGSKLWFLDPPGREFIVNEAIYDYLVRTGGAPGSMRCLQGPGDLLYVPRSWSHASICLSDCIGTSHEFSHQQFDLRD